MFWMTARRVGFLTPPKTHWALRLDEPPFYGFIRCGTGLTFNLFRRDGGQAGGRSIDETAGRRSMCLPPARSWGQRASERDYRGGGGTGDRQHFFGRAGGREAAGFCRKREIVAETYGSKGGGATMAEVI
jgi:hypothetical protein